ncbi:MAG: exodeoxyribonuclease VII large subunit [Tenericutes bacterium GWF2_57_13]|nr:MAG: exodeoxyribonuclease VII large subunit [Tenericutes bacterium GWF2_57_13]
MERTPITVSALNGYLKAKFDADRQLGDILLKAEVSNFKRNASGHLYFSLKDENSQISAVMFSGPAASLKFRPKDGDRVLVEGSVAVYVPYGQYQVYVRRMTDVGKGDLWLEFERLKQKLELEGLFRPERKRPLPAFPRAVGVVTSPTGAAVRDVINIIGRRWPLSTIIVYPAAVQGAEAKESVIRAIAKANADALVDVLIVGRGGGSIEDLWVFNEETVAYAIRDSRLPVISAVGHETDFTISDFVADLRAPTPSGAAELVVPDRRALFDQIGALARKLDYMLAKTRSAARDRLAAVESSYVFRTPERLLEKASVRLATLDDRLDRVRPDRLLAERRTALGHAETRMQSRLQAILAAAGYAFGRAAERLELVNPLAIMTRGYAIVRKDERIVRSVAELAKDDEIDVRLADGNADCRVLALRKGV